MAEDSLRRAFDCLSDGIVIADNCGRIVYLNAAVTRLFGKDPSGHVLAAWPEALGLYVVGSGALLAAEELPIVRALGGADEAELELRVHNDSLAHDTYVAADAHAWRDASGGGAGAVMVVRDISRRWNAELQLRQHRWFLESIVEHVPAMIFVKEASELKFERFNRAGEELLGMAREDLIGRNDYDFFPRDQADFFVSRDREALRLGAVIDIPEEPIQTRGGLRWLHTRKVPIFDDGGSPVFLLGISEDITGRKAAMEELESAHRELEERVRQRTAELQRTNESLQEEIAERLRTEESLRKSEAELRQAQKMEAIGRLAGGVAHDFNNMLTVILSYSDLLRRQPEVAQVRRDMLHQIVSAAQRAAALTQQLLAFSRQQVMQPVRLAPPAVIREIEEMIRRLVGEHIAVRIQLSETGDIFADRSQFEQVLLNLVVNARDAMPSGGVLTIETLEVELLGPLVSAHATLPPGPYIILAVSDTGVGMDPPTLARAFEPFFTTKPKGVGTGLGLSMCYGIVKQSGGDISAYSEPGRGTTIKVYLPRLAEVTEITAPPAPKTEARSLMSATILLAEDDPLVRGVAEAVLVSAGLSVLATRSPQEALLTAAAHPSTIHLLLTDVVMPGMSGRELADEIRKQRPQISVLYMSGYTDNAIVHHGVLDSGVAFLPKPFTPEGLLGKVQEVLSSRPPAA